MSETANIGALVTGDWTKVITCSMWIMGLELITPATWQQMQGSWQLPFWSVSIWHTIASATAVTVNNTNKRSAAHRR
jgi:hypothetical protein